MSVASFQTIERPRLLGKGRAFLFEEREEDAVRFGGGEFRENVRHVRVALVDAGSDRDLAAELRQTHCQMR